MEEGRGLGKIPKRSCFEILNEPKGIGFENAKGASKYTLYNAAVQAIRDVDPDRPILIGAPGYNDSEFLDPYVTEQYLTYKFEGGKGFYDDVNTGVAIHFYSPGQMMALILRCNHGAWKRGIEMEGSDHKGNNQCLNWKIASV